MKIQSSLMNKQGTRWNLAPGRVGIAHSHQPCGVAVANTEDANLLYTTVLHRFNFICQNKSEQMGCSENMRLSPANVLNCQRHRYKTSPIRLPLLGLITNYLGSH